MSNGNPPIKVTLDRGKDTKNTVRFDAADENEAIQSLYVPKDTMARLGDPQSIEVTITAA